MCLRVLRCAPCQPRCCWVDWCTCLLGSMLQLCWFVLRSYAVALALALVQSRAGACRCVPTSTPYPPAFRGSDTTSCWGQHRGDSVPYSCTPALPTCFLAGCRCGTMRALKMLVWESSSGLRQPRQGRLTRCSYQFVGTATPQQKRWPGSAGTAASPTTCWQLGPRQSARQTMTGATRARAMTSDVLHHVLSCSMQ